MYELIDETASNFIESIDVSVVHSLPGRIRIHLHNCADDEWKRIEQTIGRVQGVQRVRANRLTGNLLINYDTAFTHGQIVLDAAQKAVILVPCVSRGESGSQRISRCPIAGAPRMRWDGELDSGPLVMPMLHLVYSCSPLGTGMHLGEIVWALKRNRPAVRAVIPALHVLCSFGPLGLALHVGELAWALAPFVLRGRRPFAEPRLA